MSPRELLSRLTARQIEITLDGDALRVRAPKGALDAESAALLKSRKDALVRLLKLNPRAGRLRALTRQALTPDLLEPLLTLTQDEIDRIVAAVPQGLANVQDIYPLSPLQEGFLFHHLLQDEGDAYISRFVVAFDRRERLDDFLDALQEVIDRHDILRTAVHWQGLAHPVQVVQREATLVPTEIATAPETVALEALMAATDPRHQRMNLQRAPLMSATLAEDATQGRWLLALLNHHLVSDHVTLELMLREIQCLLHGHADALPQPRPYRHFIA